MGMCLVACGVGDACPSFCCDTNVVQLLRDRYHTSHEDTDAGRVWYAGCSLLKLWESLGSPVVVAVGIDTGNMFRCRGSGGL